MFAEVNFGGVFIAGALVTACMASVLLLIVKRLLLSLNLYRFFWHRYLVDLALFAILWVAVVVAVSQAFTFWRLS